MVPVSGLDPFGNEVKDDEDENHEDEADNDGVRRVGFGGNLLDDDGAVTTASQLNWRQIFGGGGGAIGIAAPIRNVPAENGRVKFWH